MAKPKDPSIQLLADCQALLIRLNQWDMLDLAVDGAYWKGEIGALLLRFRKIDGQNQKLAEIRQDMAVLSQGPQMKGSLLIRSRSGKVTKGVTVTGPNVVQVVAAYGRWCWQHGYNIYQAGSGGFGHYENDNGDVVELKM